MDRVHYDEIIKNLFNISGRLTIYALNGLFNRNFSEDTEITHANNELIKRDYSSIYTDTVLNVKTEEGIKKYHIEVQTAYDNTIIIRMIEYGYNIMLNDIDVGNIDSSKEIDLEFPSQVVIFLKERNGIPDKIKANIKMPDTGQIIKYAVPIFKIWEHDINYYKTHKLYILYPFLIIRIDKKIQSIKQRKIDEEQRQILLEECKNELIKLTERVTKSLINEKEEGQILLEELSSILVQMENLSAELYGDEIKDIDMEVNKVVKTFIDPELIEQGMQKGIEQGMQKGKLERDIEILLKGIKKKLGSIPKSLEEKIKSSDMDTLDKAIDALLDNKPTEEIEAILNGRK